MTSLWRHSRGSRRHCAWTLRRTRLSGNIINSEKHTIFIDRNIHGNAISKTSFIFILCGFAFDLNKECDELAPRHARPELTCSHPCVVATSDIIFEYDESLGTEALSGGQILRYLRPWSGRGGQRGSRATSRDISSGWTTISISNLCDYGFCSLIQQVILPPVSVSLLGVWSYFKELCL